MVGFTRSDHVATGTGEEPRDPENLAKNAEHSLVAWSNPALPTPRRKPILVGNHMAKAEWPGL